MSVRNNQAIPATVGEDYLAFASTGLVIPAGQRAKTLAITIKGDTVAESNEVVALKAANVKYERHFYPGTQHGFHNDTTPRYDAAAAKLAWERTLAFFNANLR